VNNITGLYFGTAGLLPAVRRQALRRFTNLLLAGGIHGAESCGAAFLHADGRTRVYRTHSSPAALLADARFLKSLAAAEESVVAMVACVGRAAAPAFARQPLQIGTAVAVVEDGVTNGEALAADLGLARKTRTAGELLLHLVREALAPPGANRAACDVSARLRLLDGPFAFVAWDRRFPECLLVGCHGRDVSFYRDETHGPIYFSNRPRLLRIFSGDQGGGAALPDNGLWIFRPDDLQPAPSRIFPECRPLGYRAPGRNAAEVAAAPGRES
jgi:hypothetical protein